MTTGDINPALKAAQEAQLKVHSCLDEGHSFRLEAGAGAGKTYSLVAALQKLISDRGSSLTQSGQRVACITYTEVAREEIAREIEDHPAILVDTIHAFCWAFLSQFQKPLRELIEEFPDRADKIAEGGGIGSKRVEYELGFFGVDEDRITLSHDDIPLLMAKLLEREKFRRLLTQQFPVIFIDEYQDTDRHFMKAITEFFFKSGTGPLIGLFGDHWQTIYRSEYELADFAIEGIDKGSNFRSVPAIVNVLNQLRPELPQDPSEPEAIGEARFFHANAYKGERTNTTHSKEDVPPDVAKAIREQLLARLEAEGWNREKTKVLMLTHNAIAAEQGYPSMPDIFKKKEAFSKKEDPAIKFFAETIEPMAAAYSARKYGEMFRYFGAAPAITAHADKIAWRNAMDDLDRLRHEGTIGDVLDHLKQTRRPQISDRVARREDALAALEGAAVPEDQTALARHKALREVPYAEVVQLVKFIEGETPLATQHSVKGAEFENVLVVLGGGWNHYNWPRLLELFGSKSIPKAHVQGYHRARNLFYVAISRPMKRLAVVATQTMSKKALATATDLFGADHVEELAIT